jgi:hypothetical protein
MSRVGRLLRRIPCQLDAERPVQRDRDPLPRIEGVAAAEAALDRADGGSAEPHGEAELRLRQPAPPSARADLVARPDELLAVAARRLE